jgi:hypothetical protein
MSYIVINILKVLSNTTEIIVVDPKNERIELLREEKG